MPRPEVSDAAEELFAALGPFADLDEAQGWPLLTFCDVLCSAAIAQIHGYVTDRDDDAGELPGWGILLDPERAPEEVLDWLAQFVGVQTTPAMTVEQKRQAILLPIGFQRGTPASLRLAVEATLTGAKTVLIDERSDGTVGVDKPYQLRVRTLETETPDEAATLAAILTQKPIGIVLTYDAIVVWDWGDLQAEHSTWADVTSTYDDWLEARTQLP